MVFFVFGDFLLKEVSSADSFKFPGFIIVLNILKRTKCEDRHPSVLSTLTGTETEPTSMVFDQIRPVEMKGPPPLSYAEQKQLANATLVTRGLKHVAMARR